MSPPSLATTWQRWLFLLAAVLACCPAQAVQAAGQDLEATVKSAYLYNFIQFIDWPLAGSPPQYIKVCLVGYQAATPLTAFANRQVRGLPIVVEQHSPDSEALSSCQVVVIDRSLEGQLPEILARLKGRPVLTVSDIPQFAERGGGIGFVLKDGRVRIEINPQVTQQAGLKVSAKLMEVAKIIQ